MKNDMNKLETKVDMLCARCDSLAREVRRLRDENRRLRDNRERAKQKIRNVIARLPESSDTDTDNDSGRVN